MRLLVVAFLLASVNLTGVELAPKTIEAFRGYFAPLETKMDEPVLDRVPGARSRALAGEIVAIPFAYRDASRGASVPVPDGLVNHWLGVMFVPGVTVEQVKAVLQDYDRYSAIYGPDVTDSKLLKNAGDEFDVFLRLHRQVKVKAFFGYNFPVEFNSTYHIKYYKTGENLHVRSISTRIAEVKDPKKSHTDENPVGDDNGYLWRLRSYWRVVPAPNGVFVELEAISLSRSVPGFVEKMVSYFTTNFPEDSMRNTLRETKGAIRR